MVNPKVAHWADRKSESDGNEYLSNMPISCQLHPGICDSKQNEAVLGLSVGYVEIFLGYCPSQEHNCLLPVATKLCIRIDAAG